MLGRFVALGAVSALVLLTSGCQKRNAENCSKGFEVTRQAIKSSDFALATQWREYSYRQCDATGEDQATLSALDQELSTAQATVKATADAEAKRKQDNDALLKLFISWVGDNRAAPDKASSAPQCDALPEDPIEAKKIEKSLERFCTASRVAGPHTLTARYWDADKTLARFQTRFAAPLTCEDFGGKAAKSWAVPAADGRTVKRSRCDLSTGPLAGLSVVVSEANNADAYVFAAGYLEKDPQTKQLAGG